MLLQKLDYHLNVRRRVAVGICECCEGAWWKRASGFTVLGLVTCCGSGVPRLVKCLGSVQHLSNKLMLNDTSCIVISRTCELVCAMLQSHLGISLSKALSDLFCNALTSVLALSMLVGGASC